MAKFVFIINFILNEQLFCFVVFNCCFESQYLKFQIVTFWYYVPAETSWQFMNHCYFQNWKQIRQLQQETHLGVRTTTRGSCFFFVVVGIYCRDITAPWWTGVWFRISLSLLCVIASMVTPKQKNCGWLLLLSFLALSSSFATLSQCHHCSLELNQIQTLIFSKLFLKKRWAGVSCRVQKRTTHSDQWRLPHAIKPWWIWICSAAWLKSEEEAEGLGQSEAW